MNLVLIFLFMVWVLMGISAKVEEASEKEASENGDVSNDEDPRKPCHKYPTSCGGGSGSGPGGAPG